MFKKIVVIAAILPILFGCSAPKKNSGDLNSLPSWYVQPQQNDASSLYGIGEGFALEDATKTALADAAARLIVSISSESTMLREENQNSANEETRIQVKQNIEKIEFSNFSILHSEQKGPRFFVEVEFSRSQFISAQQEKLTFLDRQIDDLNKNISSQNLIQKRNSLTKILDLARQAEILARILQSSGGDSNLKAKLALIANTQNQLNKLTDKVEFYFEINSSKEISSIIRSALNKERIKVAQTSSSSSNQVKISIRSSKTSGEVYGAHITKIKIDFENKSGGNVIASNMIEVSGSSSISEKESYFAALESFKEKIAKDGILKVLGIL